MPIIGHDSNVLLPFMFYFEIVKRNLKWHGHLLTNNNQREANNSRLEGRKKRGRPRNQREQYTGDSIQITNSMDREQYRKWTNGPTLTSNRGRWRERTNRIHYKLGSFLNESTQLCFPAWLIILYRLGILDVNIHLTFDTIYFVLVGAH